MNEFLSSLVTGFVSTFTALNINVATSSGIIPDVNVPNIALNQEELAKGFPNLFENYSGESVNYYSFIQSGAAGLLLSSYGGTQSSMQGAINMAAGSTAGASSYRGIISNGINSSGGAANSAGGAYGDAHGAGQDQGAQFSSTGGSHGGANLTATLTGGDPNKPYQKTGKITVMGNTYDFVSGRSPKYKFLPVGSYNVRKHRNSRSDSGFAKDGIGFSYVLEDSSRVGSDKMRDPDLNRDRTYLRIHPDGGGYGTSGCIGLAGGRNILSQFRADMNAELQGKSGVNLQVGTGSHNPGATSSSLCGVPTATASSSASTSSGTTGPQTCPLVKKYGATLHKDFMSRYEQLKSYADRNGIDIIITSSFRDKGQKVNGAIVPPSNRSNHFIGYAIDFNIRKGKEYCNSTCLQSSRYSWSRDFIKEGVRLGLRWGGNFTKTDPVHFDIPVNINNKAQWDRLFTQIESNCTSSGEPKSDSGSLFAATPPVTSPAPSPTPISSGNTPTSTTSTVPTVAGNVANSNTAATPTPSTEAGGIGAVSTDITTGGEAGQDVATAPEGITGAPENSCGPLSPSAAYDGKRICTPELAKRFPQYVKPKKNPAQGIGIATHFGLSTKGHLDGVDNSRGSPNLAPGGKCVRQQVRDCIGDEKRRPRRCATKCFPGKPCNHPLKSDCAGIPTDDPNLYGVALPSGLLKALGGGGYKWARDAAVELKNSKGQTVIARIVDVGPGKKQLNQGKIVDETYAVNKAMGGDGLRSYCILPGYFGGQYQ